MLADGRGFQHTLQVKLTRFTFSIGGSGGGNLTVLFLASFVFIAILVFSHSSYLLIPFPVIATCLAAGALLSPPVPNIHWRGFKHAVQRREILLMVDVTPSMVNCVGQYVHRLDPEAVTDGVGWGSPRKPDCRRSGPAAGTIAVQSGSGVCYQELTLQTRIVVHISCHFRL